MYALGDVMNELGVLGDVGVATLQSKFKFRCNERLSNCGWSKKKNQERVNKYAKRAGNH